MQSYTPNEREIVNKLTKELEKQRKKPLVISIMGQTGVGKSTLIYSLFNITDEQASLRPDIKNSVRPVTKQVREITIAGMRNFPITVYDMPGIGDSEEADYATLRDYREYFLRSDIVLWTIHIDNRSITFDVQALRFMLSDLPSEQRDVLMGKLTFVLTKADVLLPTPWVMGCVNTYAVFSPGRETKEILEAKELYYQETLMKPFEKNIHARTYNNANFILDDPAFSHDERHVYYHGLLTNQLMKGYRRRYPQYAEIFERLYDNYRVIPCSAIFRYNLPQLLLAILYKLSPSAIENFDQQLDIDTLNRVPLHRAKELCNIRIIDMHRKRTIFDLSSRIFPNRWESRLFR
jgi:GTP-binding protein EngB required for normal cell division